MKKGVNIAAENKDKMTALHKAAKRASKAVVRLILEKEANVSVANRYGRTVLHVVARNKYEAVMQLLIERGGRSLRRG
jgi:ankyrin repeat protein